jgi:hypothetical protein
MHHGTRLRCSGWGVLKNVDSGHVVVAECGFLTTACENIGLPKMVFCLCLCATAKQMVHYHHSLFKRIPNWLCSGNASGSEPLYLVCNYMICID